MKAIVILMVLGALQFSAKAQIDSTNRIQQRSNENLMPPDKTQTEENLNTSDYKMQYNNDTLAKHPSGSDIHPNGYVMQNGKLMLSKEGKMTLVDKEITFNDGSRLMSDGTIIRKDGTKLKIIDGEYVNLSGKVVKSDRSKDMYLVPDKSNDKNE